MAEGVFRNVADTHPKIGKIDSAGTGAYHVGEGPDSRTMSTLRRHGIANYNHAARKITKDDFLKFDYLLAMDKYNLRDLLDVRESVVASLRRKADTQSAAKDARVAKVRLFGDFGKGGKLHDRVGGGEVVEDLGAWQVSGRQDARDEERRIQHVELAIIDRCPEAVD